MAKKHDLSLDYLKSIKQNQPLPGMEYMREWLVGQGMLSQNDNICVPNHIVAHYPPVYLPSNYDQIDFKTLRAVINMLDEVEKVRRAANARPEIEISPAAQEMLDAYPQFAHRMEGDMLQVYAREYPEFSFNVPYKGDEKNILPVLGHMLEHYGSNNASSLSQYIRNIEEAAAYGLVRERRGNESVLVSMLDNRPPIALQGDTLTLFDIVKRHANENVEAVEQQHDYIASLKHIGFTKVDIDTERTHHIILAHPDLPREMAAPIHGELGYMDPAGWQSLMAIVREAANAKHRHHGKSKKMHVSPPSPDDTLLVYDAGALFDLCVPRAGDPGETWLDLLNMTKKLPGIGKIIIPDYIADVEMRNKAAVYTMDGELEFVNLWPTRKQPPAAFRELMKHAVRRHINDKGEVEYIAEPGAEGNGGKVIIWETSAGREEEINMANAIASGRNHYRKPNFGEKQISQIISNELDWKNNVAVVTNDLRYIYRDNPPKRTRAGKLVSYDSTYGYLEGEFLARGEEIKRALHLGHTDYEAHYRNIVEQMDYSNETQVHAHIGGHDEAEGIIGIIGNSVRRSREAAAMPKTTAHKPAPTTPVAPPPIMAKPPQIEEPVNFIVTSNEVETLPPPTNLVDLQTQEPPKRILFSKVESTSLGNVLKQVLRDDPVHTAAHIKALMQEPHTRLMKKTVERALRGNETTPPRSDLLYFMLEKMDAVAEAHGLLQTPSQDILSVPYHSNDARVDAVLELLPKLATDKRVAAQFVEQFMTELVKEVNEADKAPPERIGPKTVEHILSDEQLPSTRVAAALRDLVAKASPEQAAAFDTQYFRTREALRGGGGSSHTRP